MNTKLASLLRVMVIDSDTVDRYRVLDQPAGAESLINIQDAGGTPAGAPLYEIRLVSRVFMENQKD
jgi:hypothetical protein